MIECLFSISDFHRKILHQGDSLNREFKWLQYSLLDINCIFVFTLVKTE